MRMAECSLSIHCMINYHKLNNLEQHSFIVVVGRIHFPTDIELVAAHFLKTSGSEVEIS